MNRPLFVVFVWSIVPFLAIISASFLLLMPVRAAPNIAPGTSVDNFVTTWKTDNGNGSDPTSITIPMLADEGHNYSVDWDNDGVFDQTGITGSVTHDFGVAGTYTIRISGSFPSMNFLVDSTQSQKIISVDQWGTGAWSTMAFAFYDADNLTIEALDEPNLSNVSDMTSMFASATSFNGDLSGWNTSNVTNMSGMFYDASAFNSDLSQWNVSNVTDMTVMFSGASAFTSDLSNWNVGNVTNMRELFAGVSGFNSDLSQWNVSNVTDMYRMFYTASAFNSDLSDWNVGNVTNMYAMFQFAYAFDSDLSDWDVSNVTNMGTMFVGLPAFDSNLSQWDVSNVTNMAFMFNGADSFTGDISSWDVGNVSTMEGMFAYASAFNSDISGWDTSSVTNMARMLAGTTVFNRDLSGWDMGNVLSMDSMIDNSGLSVTNYDTLLTVWSSKQLPHNVDFAVYGLEYCFASSQRQLIIEDLGWTFTGDSMGCKVLINGESAASIAEASPAGTKVGTLSAKDFVPRTTAPYALSCTTAGVDDNWFAIGGSNTSELRTSVVFEYNNPVDANGDNIYDICIQAVETGGRVIDTPIQITVILPMTVSGISPNNGNINKVLQPVVISGNLFDPSVTVKFGNTEAVISAVYQDEIHVAPPQSSIIGPVDVTISKPGQAPIVMQDGFTYTAPTPKVISSVVFSVEDGKKIMTVTGTGLVGADDPNEYLGGMYSDKSFVTLNASALDFCTDGTGYDAATLESYGMTKATDDPPCYYLMNSVGQPIITPTTAKVYLDASFDTAAQGTVSVNGSGTFTYNQSTTPNQPDTPTALVDNKSLNGGPTIDKRPTFSGTAEPGSQITVTVTSDPVVCTATADVNGNWSCTLPSDLVPGQHIVNIHIVLPGGGIQDLGPYSVTVDADGTSMPVTNTTPLAPMTGEQRIAALTSPLVLAIVAGGLFALGTLAYMTFSSLREARIRTRK